MKSKQIVVSVLVAAVFGAAGFALGWMMRAADDSQQTVEQEFYDQLKTNMKNGMTIQQVSELVGDDMLERNYQIPESIVDHYRRLFETRGSAISADDEICAIRIGDTILVLQFRNDRLINCRPDIDFGDPESMVSGVAG